VINDNRMYGLTFSMSWYDRLSSGIKTKVDSLLVKYQQEVKKMNIMRGCGVQNGFVWQDGEE